MSWSTIRYRDFYDVPRIFITTHNRELYLFDCPFDEELDDYSDRYKVYQLPAISEDELQGSWEHLPERAASVLGTVPVAQVQFDTTKQKQYRHSGLRRNDRRPKPTVHARGVNSLFNLDNL